MTEPVTAAGLEKVYLSGGKRTNIGPSEWLDDWWVGWGKDESCQFEGPWEHMAQLAALILSHPNTAKVAPDLYRPPVAVPQPSRYRLLVDDEVFDLRAGDILVCEPMHWAWAPEKVAVLYRESDGYEPGCSQYRHSVEHVSGPKS